MHDFESLPTELLTFICEYLDDTHRPSLHSLALANRACHVVAFKLLARSITFVVDPILGIRKNLLPWFYTLQRTASFQYVHRLEIQDQDKQHYSESDDGWEELMTFVELLPSLSDLIWACSRQIPVRLIRTLQSRQPLCRLHVETFYIYPFRRGGIYNETVEVITSPCLHKFVVNHSDLEDDDDMVYSENILLELVAGGAPNLNEVRTFRPHNVPRTVQLPRLPSRDLSTVANGAPGKMGSLQGLEFAGYGILELSRFQLWSKHTDFSALRVLKLESKAVVEVLEWLAYECKPLALTSFTIHTECSGPHSVRVDDALQQLLSKLPPLTELGLIGNLRPGALTRALQHAGPTLQKLSLNSREGFNPPLVASREDIEGIAKHCPHLRDVALTIPRSKGDAKETALYRLLGSLPHLKYLRIVLHANHPRFPPSQQRRATAADPSFDAFDRECLVSTVQIGMLPLKGHVRNAFMNGAMDETLARAVFETISAAKPPSALLLERLDVSIMVGNNISMLVLPALTKVLRHIMRRYSVERNVRDDRRAELIVVELGRSERIKEVEDRRGMVLSADVEAVFRRIWPARKRNSRGWWDDWASLPLVNEC